MNSDVSIVNTSLIVSNKIKLKLSNCSLRYPTGEKVVVKEKGFYGSSTWQIYGK